MQGSSHRSNTMRGQPRGLWSWGLPDADARRPAGASQRSSVRNLLVCGLLLLTLPASSTDVQHSSFPALQCGAERNSAATASRAMPSFVGVRAAGGFPVHSLPHVCRRRPQSSAAPSLHVMVSVQARTGSAGESSTQTRVRQTQASSIADGVNASFKSVVERRVANARKELEASVASEAAPETPTPTPLRRRRGIGGRMEPTRTSKQASLSVTAVKTAAKSNATLKNIEKMKGEEFLNQEALLRLARSKLLEIADDMAGGSRWGTDRGVAPAPRSRKIMLPRSADEIGEDSLTDGLVEEETNVVISEYSPDVESDWEAQKRAVAKPAGAKGRWRSRLRSMRPEGEAFKYSVEETEYVQQVGLHRDAVSEELLRQAMSLKKGRAQGGNALVNDEDTGATEFFLNPGFMEQRRDENERAAQVGGSLSGIPLTQLAKRGLIGHSRSAQDLLQGASAVEHNVDLGGAVFDLKVRGDILYSAGSDDSVTMYNTHSWDKIGELKGHKGWVNAMAVDEARNLMYTASEDKSVKVWDLTTHECIKTLKGHQDGAISLEIVDSRLVVGCTGTMMVWDTNSWKLLHKLSNHTQVLRAMSDGKQLSKNLGLDPRIEIAREASKLFGNKVGGLAASKHHLFSAVDEGSIWVWEKRHLDVERKLLGPIGFSAEAVWVRSLEVISVENPTTGKPCLKLCVCFSLFAC